MKGELCNAVVVALGTTTRSGIMEWSQKVPPQISYQLSNECIWGKNYRTPVHRYKSLDFFVIVVSALIIGIDFFTPISTKRNACSDIANRFRDRFIEDMRTLAVSVVVHGSVTADTITCGSFNCINVRSDEQELPAILLFLPLNHLLDLLTCVTVTCILLSVSCDHKHRMFRHILGASIRYFGDFVGNREI